MKSTNKGLYLSVPTPCNEDWNQMTRTAAGKHCSSCNKTVVDFSLLSDAEIFTVITNGKGRICGRFVDTQLNRPLVAPEPPRHQLMPAMVITAGLAIGMVTATHAETRVLEQIEMGVPMTHSADSSVTPKPMCLPEIVVTGYNIKSPRNYSTGAVMVVPAQEIIVGSKTSVSQPTLYKTMSTEAPKKKKKFLFF